jgi:hypothetical protein
MSHDAEVQWEKDYNMQSQLCVLSKRVDQLTGAMNLLIEDNSKMKQRLLALYKDRRGGWWERWFGRGE